MMVKRLRQEAGIRGVEDAAAAKTARRIRRLAVEVLRKKYGTGADEQVVFSQELNDVYSRP